MDIDYMIKVMQAYRDGAVIESALKYDDNVNWVIEDIPCWDWSMFLYRIKC